jgi:hypothetical protein
MKSFPTRICLIAIAALALVLAVAKADSVRSQCHAAANRASHERILRESGPSTGTSQLMLLH